MCFCNIPAWGAQAKEPFEVQRHFDVIGFVETHLSATAAALKTSDMQRWGRRPFWSHAAPSLKSGSGTSGGALIAPRLRFACAPRSAVYFADPVGNKFSGDDWVCTVFTAQGFSYVAVLLYLVHSIGAAGINLVRLSAISTCLLLLGLPFFICTDWNTTLAQQASSGFLALTGATIM